MPYNPGSGEGQVYISRALGQTAASYDQSLDAFAWKVMFPKIPVQQSTGEYPEFPVGDWARLVAGPRGENEEAKTGGFKAQWKPYTTSLQAVGSDLGQRARNNQEPVMKLKQRKAKWVTKQLNMLLEKAWANAYFKSTSSWTNKWQGIASGTPSATQFLKWSDPGSSPIATVNDLKSEIHKDSGGFEPNAGALGYAAFQKLKTHPEIVDRIKHTTDESVHIEMIKRYFELEKLVICKALENTAAPGVTTAAMDYICGNSMLLAYVNEDPAISEDAPSAGYTFWNEGMEGSIDGLQIAEIPIPTKRIVRIEAQVDFQMHVVAADLGGLLYDLI